LPLGRYFYEEKLTLARQDYKNSKAIIHSSMWYQKGETENPLAKITGTGGVFIAARNIGEKRSIGSVDAADKDISKISLQ